MKYAKSVCMVCIGAAALMLLPGTASAAERLCAWSDQDAVKHAERLAKAMRMDEDKRVELMGALSATLRHKGFQRDRKGGSSGLPCED